MRGVLLSLCVVLSACGGGGGPESSRVEAQSPVVPMPTNPAPEPPQAPPRAPTSTPSDERAPEISPVAANDVAAWGDSLTKGMAPELQRIYPKNAVFMGGVGGEPSYKIRDRFLADTANHGRTTIIWAGRINYSSPLQVEADVAAMVAALPHDRFLVLSVINGDVATEYAGQPGYVAMAGLNDRLAATYASRFVDVRTPLVAAHDSTQPGDLADADADIVPRSLRIDSIHLTARGYAMVARAVADQIAAHGW